MYSGHAEEIKGGKRLLNRETVSLSVALHCIATLEQLEQMSQAEYCMHACIYIIMAWLTDKTVIIFWR